MTGSPIGGLLPEAIGRYHVIDRLGAGAFATVYLADDPALDTPVAIKLLASNHTSDPDVRSRFVHEARLLRQLWAPGLVTVHDIGEHEAQPYLVMEHCAGGTLADRLASRGRPLTVAEGRDLARRMAGCLRPLHQAGVVHRDLKPSNFLIRRRPGAGPVHPGSVLEHDEELVVADFGLAKVIDVAATRLSLAGGTPGYSAPEQFRGAGDVDATADLYALSAIVASALLGQPPRPVLAGGGPAFDPIELAALGEPGPALARGLTPDRRARPPDLDAWLAGLEEASGAATVPAGPTAARPIPTRAGRQPGGRRVMAVVLTAIALLALTAGGAVAAGIGPFARSGPAVVGPTTGPVGAEAVFALASSETGRARWTVNDVVQPEGRMISVTPSTAGTVTIQVDLDGRSTVLDLRAEPTSALAIEGPGRVAVDETLRLDARGPEAAEFTWEVVTADGPAVLDATGPALQLTPSSEGTVQVTLRIDGAEPATRTITVAGDG